MDCPCITQGVKEIDPNSGMVILVWFISTCINNFPYCHRINIDWLVQGYSNSHIRSFLDHLHSSEQCHSAKRKGIPGPMSPQYQSGLLQPPSRLSLVGPRGGIIMPMGSQLSADFSQQQWNNMVAKVSCCCFCLIHQ